PARQRYTVSGRSDLEEVAVRNKPERKLRLTRSTTACSKKGSRLEQRIGVLRASPPLLRIAWLARNRSLVVRPRKAWSNDSSPTPGKLSCYDGVLAGIDPEQ